MTTPEGNPKSAIQNPKSEISRRDFLALLGRGALWATAGENRDWISKGLGQEGKLVLPSFTDDLAVRIECTQPAKRTTVPGTQ